MIWSTVHTARKAHYCDGCARYAIKPGQRYRKGKASPGTDLINEGPHWAIFRECADCATRYGRGHLIGGAA
ncbi:hypothetical protein AB0L13_16720 [Saccharopolyspora shandongensis]|uniref:hypothetical protein n=1 Tax=Saccharopolyspora shandongensis TaxID=418495 RepID=UPI003413B2FB